MNDTVRLCAGILFGLSIGAIVGLLLSNLLNRVSDIKQKRKYFHKNLNYAKIWSKFKMQLAANVDVSRAKNDSRQAAYRDMLDRMLELEKPLVEETDE